MTETDLRVILDVLVSREAIIALAAFLIFILIVRYVAVGRSERREFRAPIVRRIQSEGKQDVPGKAPRSKPKKKPFNLGRVLGMKPNPVAEPDEAVDDEPEEERGDGPSFQD